MFCFGSPNSTSTLDRSGVEVESVFCFHPTITSNHQRPISTFCQLFLISKYKFNTAATIGKEKLLICYTFQFGRTYRVALNFVRFFYYPKFLTQLRRRKASRSRTNSWSIPSWPPPLDRSSLQTRRCGRRSISLPANGRRATAVDPRPFSSPARAVRSLPALSPRLRRTARTLAVIADHLPGGPSPISSSLLAELLRWTPPPPSALLQVGVGQRVRVWLSVALFSAIASLVLCLHLANFFLPSIRII